MAYIEMNYILTDKELEENKTVEQITHEYFSGTEYTLKDGYYETDEGGVIKYHFENKRGSTRYYLRLSTNIRINKGLEALQKFDDRLLKSDYNKYVGVIRTYDGISAALCKKLYPKYSNFERKMRQLILLVLTKAFGDKWVDITISEETQKSLKERAKAKGNLKISEVLEQFELAQLEDYLFEDRLIDFNSYFKTELTAKKVLSMNEKELRRAIENMRPKSLWASNFSDIGDEEKWKEKIVAIHDYRNRVAHHKTINQEQYKIVNTKLNQLNKDIDKAIGKIQDRDFTSVNSLDVLNNFSTMMRQLSNNIFAQYDFVPLIEEISNAVKKMMDAVSSEAMQNMVNVLKPISININRITESFRLSPETIENMKKWAELMSRESQDYQLYLEQVDDSEEEYLSNDNGNEAEDDKKNDDVEDSDEAGDDKNGND